jgi:hypothetical protein
MKTRTLMRFAGDSLAATMLATIVGLSAPAYGSQCFSTPTGATESGGNPVAATACFDVSTNLVSVSLTNTLANPTSVAQLLSDIFFTTSGSYTGGLGVQNSVAPTTSVLVAANGTYTTGTFTDQWTLTQAGTRYHLDGLGAGATGPEGLIIGPPGPGNLYSNANSSIAGNDPHNPFAGGTVTFALALLGASAATIISDVVFSFGTATGNNVAVPIPAAIWLFASGLLGLIGIARRKYGGASTASPMAA